MARLTKERWEYARNRWEGDPREGFDWLATELNGDVSRQAISKMARKEGWAKGGAKVSEKVAQPRKQSCATKSEVAQPATKIAKPKPKTIPVITDAEWEAVDEKAEKLHGNSKYDQSFDEWAYWMCVAGATDEELAGAFHVTEQTINNWKNEHQSFFESVHAGKLHADAKAAKGLFRRACGYRYVETKTKKVLVQEEGQDGEMVDGDYKVVEIIEIEKEMPAEPGAAFNFLKNRRPQNWRDKIDVNADIQVNQLDASVLEQRFLSRMMEAHERQLKVLEDRGLKNG